MKSSIYSEAAELLAKKILDRGAAISPADADSLAKAANNLIGCHNSLKDDGGPDLVGFKLRTDAS